MADLLLQNLRKQFHVPKREPVLALDNLNLEMGDGELLTLLGPSGCGKTTTLRLIAGLEQPDGGAIRMAGQGIETLPPRHRNVAMVFQRPSLLPQLNVAENIGLPARLRKLPDGRALIENAAERAGVGDLLNQSPETLSGGQAQRVALARALVVQPALILLDEPLSNLDPPSRVTLRRVIQQTLRETGTTALYVTHDQMEAMSLGGRIAIMNNGRIEQVGTVRKLYREPANLFVARFFGDGVNLIPDGETVLAFRPSDAVLGGDGLFSGEVVDVIDLGHSWMVTVRSGANEVRVSRGISKVLGQRVAIQVPPERLLRFDSKTGSRL